MMIVLSTIRYPAKMRATFCTTDGRAYQVLEIKNAGGNPPALGQPSDTERWLLFTIDNNILPKKSYEFGESLADRFLYSIETLRLQVAQVVFLECSPFAKEQHISDLTAKTSVEPLSANLFEVVLLEISDTSEKLDVGSRFQVPLVLGSRQLDSAQIIGDLREPVQFGGGVFVYGRLTRDGALDSEVKRLRYDALPVIVVDFHLVKVLQIGLLRSKGALHVGFYCSRQLGSICDATALLENECGVSDGKMFREYSECMKLTLPAANVFPFVVVLPIKQWVEMKGDCIEQLFREGAFVLGGIGLNGLILPMEHQSDKVKIGSKCRIARFVYENRQLPHEPTPFKIKMSGGKPPDARRSLYSRKPLILYHAEHFLSSRNCNKQMFEIQCKLAA